METQKWIQFFEENKRHADSTRPDFSVPCELDEGPALSHLRKSLAVFQLGETGEGTALKKFAKRFSVDGTSDYSQAVALFVGEEKRHATYLAEAVSHLGGNLISTQWTNVVFRFVRRMINLEFELQILMTAEIVGLGYYALLGEEVPDKGIKSLCKRLASDEVGHLRFHADFFRTRFTNARPTLIKLWRWQFRLIFTAVLSVAWWDHRNALRAFDISRSNLFRRCNRSYHRFLTEIFQATEQKNPGVASTTPGIEHLD